MQHAKIPLSPWSEAARHEGELQTTLNALARHEVKLSAALHRPLVGGNRCTVLVDGEAAYAAMFEAIESARDHINLESYIVEAEGPGAKLAELLKQKCAQGVKVNLIYDSWGSWPTRSAYFDELFACGVKLVEFNPVLPWRLRSALFRHASFSKSAGSLNRRDHRKLLVVDGRIAFTGGVNISKVYASGSAGGTHSLTNGRSGQERRTQDPLQAYWRDTHVRLEGPIVREIQQLFLQQWRRQSGSNAQPACYYPVLPENGTQRMALAASQPGTRRSPFYRALLTAIDSARDRISITAGYFVPTRRLMRSLIAAARRGVQVRLVLPGFSDAPAALHAGRSQYARLLMNGIQIHEHCDVLLHAKTTVIDGVWASVGSHNLDWRSFVHNAEANIVVVNRGFAQELEHLFERDIAVCQRIRLTDWQQRGRWVRVKEWAARQFEYLL